MINSILGIAVCALAAVGMARVHSPALGAARRPPARALGEAALLVVGLLAVPAAGFNLLWLTGWRSAYLAFGLIAIPLLIWLEGGRPADSGFRLPVDRKPLPIVASIAGLLLVARVAEPLVTGTGFRIDARTLVMSVVVFALLEEALFRGLMQTRLESALGPTRACLLTALFFGFYHYYVRYLIPGRAVDVAAALQLGYLTAFGLLLGMVYAKSRSLLPPFLLHAVNNLSF